MTINHNDWTQYDAQGYLQARAVQVRHNGNAVSVGSYMYSLDDLRIEPNRIEHVAGAWYLVR